MNADVSAALLVGLGGGIGAIVRYLVDGWITSRARRRNDGSRHYPWGILAVNLSGSLLLGLVVGLGAGAPMLTAGVLGGYTTFSTASLDTLRLARERKVGTAVLNGIGMLCGAMLCAACGIALGRAFG